MSNRQSDSSHNFTQDPLDVIYTPSEHENEYVKSDGELDEVRDLPAKIDAKPAKREKKTVSITQPRTQNEMSLRTRPPADSMVSDIESTPLLHPSSSLPTVVGYDRFMDDYPGPSSSTRSEVGRSELVRKKRKRRARHNTLSTVTQRTKQRPFIISPFMPISTQISIDASRPAEWNAPPSYGSTTDNLLSKDSSEESGSDEEGSESTIPEKIESELTQAFKTIHSLSSKQIVTIGILCVVNFCSTVAFSCLAPFYPKEGKEKGLSDTAIGLVFGAFELTMVIASPVFGKYIINIGAKRMFIIGVATTGLSSIVFGYLNYLPPGDSFFWSCMIVRVLEAIGNAGFVTSSFAIAARSFPRNVQAVLGVLEGFAGFGYTAGPIIGGGLFDAGGYKLPFIAIGGTLLLSAVLALFFLEHRKEEKVTGQEGMLAMLKIPEIWVQLSVSFACAVSLSFLEPTLAIHLEEYNMTPTEIGLFFLLDGGTYTIGTIIVGTLLDKYHHGKVYLFIGCICTAIAMLLIGPSPLLSTLIPKNFFIIGFSLVLLGIAASAMFLPSYQGCMDAVKDAGFEDNLYTRGCVTGIYQAAFSLGSFIGPTGGSMLVESIKFPWTTTIIAFFNVFMSIALVLTLLKRCLPSR